MTPEELAEMRNRYHTGEHGVELVQWNCPAQAQADALALFQHVELLLRELDRLRTENAALRSFMQDVASVTDRETRLTVLRLFTVHARQFIADLPD